jgi:hypothetical protein
MSVNQRKNWENKVGNAWWEEELLCENYRVSNIVHQTTRNWSQRWNKYRKRSREGIQEISIGVYPLESSAEVYGRTGYGK